MPWQGYFFAIIVGLTVGEFVFARLGSHGGRMLC